MRIERVISSDILPCSSNYQIESQPYYIVAPAYKQQSAGIRLLHELCSLLNQLGYEAYVDTPEVSGSLWSPRLTDATKVAHYKAGKKPIVVYPEVVKGVPMGLGLPVRYVLNYPGFLGGEKTYSDSELIFTFHSCYFPGVPRMRLPISDISRLAEGRLEPEARTEIAFYHNRYTKSGGSLRDFGPKAIEISSTFPDSNEKTLAILKRARILYSYEPSGIILEATLCGCAVVFLPNPITLPKIPEVYSEVGMEGIAWGDSPEAVEQALQSVREKWPRFLEEMKPWRQELDKFVRDTQTAAQNFSIEKAWPANTLDTLPLPDLNAIELAGRAERRKYARLNEHYERWMDLCTLREIDADIYAEHLMSGKLPGISVCIDHRHADVNLLADTLDSLGGSLGQPASLSIVSEVSAPAELAGDKNIEWVVAGAEAEQAGLVIPKAKADWILVVKSGTRLATQALVEWGLATTAHPSADLIYADDDVWTSEDKRSYPNFKSDANIELLRCTNYLGNAVLMRASVWRKAGCPLSPAEVYRLALQRTQASGRSALGHVDAVLSHTTGLLSQQLENQEYLAASEVLVKSGMVRRVQPQARLGTWLVDYVVPPSATVSLVVPSGLQTGYLRSMVESLQLYPHDNLTEIIVVTAPDQVTEVEYALSDVMSSVPLHIVQVEHQEYNHGRALNAGIARACGAFVLVCDDDLEMLHADWLTVLLGLVQQADVGCVSPRLMANRGQDAKVVGGPMVLGIQGTWAPYIGEEGRLDEPGVYSRLQLTQDVGAVAGHCFMFRKEDWAAVGGFNEREFSFWYPVLDFCLRLSKLGKRHIWTPLSNVLHQGGKTVASVARDTRKRLRLAESELSEKDALLVHWAKELANDPCYNRHLSLMVPFDLEPNIVIDWQPKRHDRPRVLAVPLTSGAGQYRVIEPLNALQDASLVQTCVLVPIRKNMVRILQPLELVRAAPDRLILQHSVDDAQLGLPEKYRLALPDLEIIQMVDDLLGDVPAKHPSRSFQTREGHQRMIQALKQSDILVVTTEPLRTHYQKYVKDVRLVPNTLDKQWVGLRKPPVEREKLRIGWVGAGQHKGDLDLVAAVIKETAAEVDWVFMGMTTEEIMPHLKEFHRFVNIADYPKKMSELDLDIAIAPLETNIFNECKSNLRLLEYGAMGWPVVCSDVFPYQTDDAPVIRCPNEVDAWVAAIRDLVADRPKRLQMGQKLHDWVASRYLLRGIVKKWERCLLD